MVVNIGDMVATIKADVTDFNRKINQVTDEVNKFKKEIEGTKRFFRRLSLAGTAAITGIIFGLKRAIDASTEFNLANRLLIEENVVGQLLPLWQEFVGTISELALTDPIFNKFVEGVKSILNAFLDLDSSTLRNIIIFALFGAGIVALIGFLGTLVVWLGFVKFALGQLGLKSTIGAVLKLGVAFLGLAAIGVAAALLIKNFWKRSEEARTANTFAELAKQEGRWDDYFDFILIRNRVNLDAFKLATIETFNSIGVAVLRIMNEAFKAIAKIFVELVLAPIKQPLQIASLFGSSKADSALASINAATEQALSGLDGSRFISELQAENARTIEFLAENAREAALVDLSGQVNDLANIIRVFGEDEAKTGLGFARQKGVITGEEMFSAFNRFQIEQMEADRLLTEQQSQDITLNVNIDSTLTEEEIEDIRVEKILGTRLGGGKQGGMDKLIEKFGVSTDR